MQVTVENLEALSRRMNIVVPAEVVNAEFQKRLSVEAKRAKIDGFRPGKVPVSVIESKYGKGILDQVAINLIEKELDAAVREKALRVAGRPQIEDFEIKKNTEFAFQATFEVYPDIDIQELEGESIEKQVAEVTDADLEKMLEQLQKQQATWSDVARAAASADQVEIDFEGSIAGEPFEGGSATGFSLELGSGRMIPGFESGIEGMAKGDVRDVTVTFPEDYQSDDLKGKEAVFKITLHKVQEAVLPPLDDALAEKMQVEGGLEGLKQKAREGMQRELAYQLRANLKAAVLDALIARNQIEVPKTLVDIEITHLQKMALQRMAGEYGLKDVDLSKLNLPKEPYQAEADRRVRLGLLLAEVVKKHEIKVDHDKVTERIKELSSAYQKPEEVEAWYLKNQEALAEVEASVIEEAAVDVLLSQASLSEKTVQYGDVIQQQN